MDADHALPSSTGSELEHPHVPHEVPEDWGWHHEFRSGRQIGGWLTFLILLALITTTHYNGAGTIAIALTMIALAAGLLWDRHRRRTQWRS
ncbi:MAG TPA: DUF2631 domain-containing protein [Jatrophihabitans sp.]|nr:DUF2631 domain-containing protein [Jatrophihabitans sp.]